MALQIDVSVALTLRVDLPPSLGDAEARRVAEAEALRRAQAVRGAVSAELIAEAPARAAGGRGASGF